MQRTIKLFLLARGRFTLHDLPPELLFGERRRNPMTIPESISDGSAEENRQDSGNMPMFYVSLRPLDRLRDNDLHLSLSTDFRFAANSNAIPLLASEFPLAATHYPIVFAAGTQPIPAAVMGLRNDTNRFIDKNGEWQNETYVPAYVRRYPFILMDDPEQKQFVLCIDEASNLLSKEGGIALFENGEPSEFVQDTMKFCATLRQEGNFTDEFVNALLEHELLIENDALIEIGDQQISLSGFLIVDSKKFDALPNKVFLKMRSKGWLPLIYAHLLSSHRWRNLRALEIQASS
jgi:hypothetical protein